MTTFPPQTIWLQRTPDQIQEQQKIRKVQKEVRPPLQPKTEDMITTEQQPDAAD